MNAPPQAAPATLTRPRVLAGDRRKGPNPSFPMGALGPESQGRDPRGVGEGPSPPTGTMHSRLFWAENCPTVRLGNYGPNFCLSEEGAVSGLSICAGSKTRPSRGLKIRPREMLRARRVPEGPRPGNLERPSGGLVMSPVVEAIRNSCPMPSGRYMSPPERHPRVFETFDGLASGASFVLVNDHDPKPLYYEFLHERTGQFARDDLESGPQVWRVRITKVAPPGSGPATGERG